MEKPAKMPGLICCTKKWLELKAGTEFPRNQHAALWGKGCVQEAPGEALGGRRRQIPQQTQGRLQSILGRLTCGDGPALDFVCPSGKISEGLNAAF